MVNVLRSQPLDLVEYAAHCFAELLENRDRARDDTTAIMVIPAQDEDLTTTGSENDEMIDESEGNDGLVCFLVICRCWIYFFAWNFWLNVQIFFSNFKKFKIVVVCKNLHNSLNFSVTVTKMANIFSVIPKKSFGQWPKKKLG